eukprot:2351261-Amphidinium_carterae.1
MLPTLVRALPRSQPPVGLDMSSLTEEAIRRWQFDSFRYSAYQYELDCLVKDRDGCLRTASRTEREKLLGYPRDHTYMAQAAGSQHWSGKMPDAKCLELPFERQLRHLIKLYSAGIDVAVWALVVSNNDTPCATPNVS